MPVSTSNPQDTQAAIAFLLILAACASIIYWRLALRVVLVGGIALAIYGAVHGFDAASHLVTAHHK
jgi:hypothetical protein